MTEKENNLYQTILNMSDIIQKQQVEIDLWKAIIQDRDETINHLKEEFHQMETDLQNALRSNQTLKNYLADDEEEIKQLQDTIQSIENYARELINK